MSAAVKDSWADVSRLLILDERTETLQVQTSELKLNQCCDETVNQPQYFRLSERWCVLAATTHRLFHNLTVFLYLYSFSCITCQLLSFWSISYWNLLRASFPPFPDSLCCCYGCRRPRYNHCGSCRNFCSIRNCGNARGYDDHSLLLCPGELNSPHPTA